MWRGYNLRFIIFYCSKSMPNCTRQGNFLEYLDNTDFTYGVIYQLFLSF